MNQDEFLTAEELAAALRVSPRTVQRLVQRGDLKVLRVGKQLRFRRDWVEEWIKKGTTDEKGEEKMA